MKLEALNSGQSTAPVNRPSQRAISTTVPTSADAEVRLSSTSASLAAGGDMPIDQARVREIRQAISEGRFQINTGAIADRLIETARDLVQRQSSADR